VAGIVFKPTPIKIGAEVGVPEPANTKIGRNKEQLDMILDSINYAAASCTCGGQNGNQIVYKGPNTSGTMVYWALCKNCSEQRHAKEFMARLGVKRYERVYAT
jgi:hypothetical protein